MFTIEYRNQVHDDVLELAKMDLRIMAGAVVGSLALSDGDRWSDLDLTFAVGEEYSMFDVLEDWTEYIEKEFDATQLFDLPSGPSIYRVFLFPGCLQVDLSFTPAAKFGATGPKFRLLFGKSVDQPYFLPPEAHDLFGYAVHHALRARFCIERGRFWQAEYWISATRDYALHLACLRRGLPAAHGRGFDDLPAEIHEVFKRAIVKDMTRDGLMRALGFAVDGLLYEIDGIQDLAIKVKPQLLELSTDWYTSSSSVMEA